MNDMKTTDMLMNIVSNVKVCQAPPITHRHGMWVECILEIDKDNTAYLTMDADAYEALKKQYEG